MKTSFVNITSRIQPLLAFIKKYAAFVFVLAFLGVYTYLVNRIGQLIQHEPSTAAIESKVKPVNKLRVDEEAVKQITELEAQNIEIKSLFDDARQNPFTE